TAIFSFHLKRGWNAGQAGRSAVAAALLIKRSLWSSSDARTEVERVRRGAQSRSSVSRLAGRAYERELDGQISRRRFRATDFSTTSPLFNEWSSLPHLWIPSERVFDAAYEPSFTMVAL